MRIVIFAFLLDAVLFSSVACGGSGTSIGDGADGGVPPGSTVPTGTCRFTLTGGGAPIPFEGTARARMNGSGNLMVVCTAGGGGAATLTLGYGNATFDGPRTYKGDDFTSDATVSWEATGMGQAYESHATGGSCTLVLSEAGPLDARGDSVVTGGHIASTFTCAGLVGSRNASPASYALTNGELSATVE